MDSNSQKPRPVREAPMRQNDHEEIPQTDVIPPESEIAEKNEIPTQIEIKTEEKTPDPSDTPATPDVPETPGTLDTPKKNKTVGPGALFLLLFIPLLIIFLVGASVFLNEHRGEDSPGLFALDKGESHILKSYISNASREVRGVYIATVYNINFPSKKGLSSRLLKSELDGIIDTCLENELNTIYFQASPNSDALYKSDLLPTSAVITGTEGASLPGGFDPLEYLCETAKEHNIAVHAWVNPMRVTGKNSDFNDLAEDNPAKIHPEWTVEYDSLTYYNLGIPEVRALIASVCAEIAKNYDVAGVMFDDYFYPYPVDGLTFGDEEQYKQYGSGYSDIGDFRRACSTELVKQCHDAVKEADRDCEFGIAPFGVWRNNDGTNGGSDTKAFQSYESLYCDTLAMIEAGTLDYVAPQLYWQISFEKAPYNTLCDWWNKAVEGSKTKLIISHAAYQANDWQSQTEFADQINYARDEKNYAGSIFYGYAAIYENDCGISSQIRSCYENEIVYTDYHPTETPVSLTSYTRDSDTLTLEGTSDVGYTLYAENEKVPQKRDGSFKIKIKTDKTQIVFTQNGKEYVFKTE